MAAHTGPDAEGFEKRSAGQAGCLRQGIQRGELYQADILGDDSIHAAEGQRLRTLGRNDKKNDILISEDDSHLGGGNLSDVKMNIVHEERGIK